MKPQSKTTLNIKQYPTIDAHGHLFPYSGKEGSELAKDQGFTYLEKRDCGCAAKWFMDKNPREADLPRQVDEEFYDPDKRVELLQYYSIDRQTILPLPALFENQREAQEVLKYHEVQNNNIAEIASKYSQFIPFCAVPIQDPDLAIKELRRAKDELGMQGVEINTMIGDKLLDDPYLEPVWEAINDLDLAVFVHPWDMKGTNRFWSQHIAFMPYLSQVAMSAVIKGGVLDKYSDLRVMFSHGGGNYFWNEHRSNAGQKARPSLFERHEAYKNTDGKKTNYFVDSNVFDVDNLEFIIKRLGSDGKMALGTDCPFPLGSAPSDTKLKLKTYPQKLIEEADLSKEDKEDILFWNAISWLEWDGKEFLSSVK